MLCIRSVDISFYLDQTKQNKKLAGFYAQEKQGENSKGDQQEGEWQTQILVRELSQFLEGRKGPERRANPWLKLRSRTKCRDLREE